ANSKIAKWGLAAISPSTLGILRTFHPARGGEASGVLPGSRPRTAPNPLWTQGLVRRVTPFFAIAAVFAVQLLTGAGPVLVFPLYLTVILLGSLQLKLIESLGAAALAAIAILTPPLVRSGRTGDIVPAALLAGVLVVVALAISEVVRQGRENAAEAQRKAREIEASEERLRMTLQAAMVGLALADADGKWTQVNEQLSLILGRSHEDLMHLTLGEVTADNDRRALDEALALLRSGDIGRWE